MPPAFDRESKKRIVQIAEEVIPEVVKDNELQDHLLKSVGNLPVYQQPSEQDVIETLKDLQKSVSAEKAEVRPKSFLYNPMQYSDTMNHPTFIRGLTYYTMHEMVKQSQIISAIINTRINQVSSFAKIPRTKNSLGFCVQKKNSKKMTDSEKKKSKFYEEFILNCGVGSAAHTRDYFEQFIKKIARDRLIVDQVNFERVFTAGQKLHEIISVDSATIRIALRKYLEKDGTSVAKAGMDSNVVYDPAPRGNQIITPYRVPDEERAFVQVMNGQIVREYTSDEMAFLVAWPRTEVNTAGYGYSEVEQLIQTVSALLFASEYNRRFFSSGSSPKGVLNVKANMNQAQMDGFKKAWLAQLSGISGAWRTPIVAAEGGLEFINMQQTNREMEFSKYNDFLIKVACAVYQIAPEEINFSSQTSGNGQGAVFESKSELRLKASRDKGLVPLLTFFENGLNREVMRYVDPDYEIVFVGLDGGTELDRLEVHEKELKNFKTVNEVREQNDLPPVEGGDVILNPTWAQIQIANQNVENQQVTLEKTQEFQAQQAEEQQRMQEEQANLQADGEEKQTKMQMEQERLKMEHERQQIKHAQMKHVMDGERMEREKNAPPKKGKPAKKDVKKSLEEWNYGDFENFEDFANEIQNNIHLGNFEKSLATLDGPLKLTPNGE